MKKILAVVAAVLLSASAGYARSIFDEIASGVKATASGVVNTVSNLNPAKLVSDTVDTSVESGQKAGEATVTVATDTVGVVSQATGTK